MTYQDNSDGAHGLTFIQNLEAWTNIFFNLVYLEEEECSSSIQAIWMFEQIMMSRTNLSKYENSHRNKNEKVSYTGPQIEFYFILVNVANLVYINQV